MATFNTPVDGAVGLQLASNYVSGSGSLALKSGQGAFFTTFPTIVTVITNSSYNTGAGEVLCEYVVTGKTTDTLTGATAVSGFTDQNFSTNDYVEGRVSVKYITDLNTAVNAGGSGTVTSVATGGGLTGGPITTTGTVAITPIANHNILANISGGTAAPSGNSTTAVIDDGVGNVAGSFAIRGASVWGVGSKFNFDNTNTCPQWTGITDPSPAALGDKWYSTSAGGLVTCRFLDGSNNALNTMEDGTFFKCNSCTAVASTASATTLLTSPTVSWGSLTIPNAALKANQAIDVDYAILLSATSTPTIILTLLFGGTVIGTSPALGVGSAPTNAGAGGYGATKILIRSIGGTGSINTFGSFFINLNGTTGTTYFNSGAGTSNADITGINYNQTNAIDFKLTWSASSSSNTAQLLYFNLRLKG